MKVGDLIGDFHQQISQNFVALPCLLWERERYHFYGVYQFVHVHAMQCKKNCVFIAAILSEVHAPWQPDARLYNRSNHP